MIFDTVEIDFADGTLTLTKNGTRSALQTVLAAHGGSLQIDHALLYGEGVSIWANTAPEGFKAVLMPPGGLPFASKDICAARIARLIHARSPRSVPTGGGETAFTWGTLKLCTAWREGGWGAYFTVRAG